MNLTPLYELRDRLKAGAVAGTALLNEDFRLPRALEAMKPLEDASPVFQKIGQSVRALLISDGTDKAPALLDALALCDAVLVTQGAVAVAGELAPMQPMGTGISFTNAPYSVLHPLLEALTGSGGGRYSFVVETHRQQPELFKDYRVKNALVQALGASYAELADTVENWLCAEGAEIVPLLKAGFDPKGKREMVRRLHVIETVCGAKENAFYLSLLEDAEKDILAAAIYALRLDDTNAERLTNLCKTEKGAAKKAAHWALARLRTPQAWTYWEDLAAKKPEQVVEFMVLSNAPKAGEFIGEKLCAFFEPFAQGNGVWSRENVQKLQGLLYAVLGKAGPQIVEFYRRASALGQMLDRAPDAEKAPALFSVYATSRSDECMVLSAVLPDLLRYSLVLHPVSELAKLAQELFETQGGAWAGPMLTATLLFEKAAPAFECCRSLLTPSFRLFGGKDEKEKASAAAIALENLEISPKRTEYVLTVPYRDPVSEQSPMYGVYRCPIKESLDERWFEELVKRGNKFDTVLMRILPPATAKNKAMLGKHFYSAALATHENQKYLEPLKLLGWPEFRGLLTRYCKGQKHMSMYVIRRYMQELPLSKAQIKEELKEALALARAGKIGFGMNGVAELEKMLFEEF